MKTKNEKRWLAAGAAVLTAAALRVSADTATSPVQPEQSYTGKVVSVAPEDRMVSVRAGWWSRKTFNLGDNCTYAMFGSTNRSDLRPGEKVTVRYQTVQGVRVADGIWQRPMQIEGMVAEVDPRQHLLTVREHGLERRLQIANGCPVMLRDNRSGSLADIQPGNRVRVTYETPADVPTARQIAQTSSEFVGTLTAIDLGEKTVKAKAVFAAKKFNVANDCAIVINGRTDGKLSDLRPNEKLAFSYDQVNGVNVVNRIAPAPPEEQKTMTTSSPMSYPAYPAY